MSETVIIKGLQELQAALDKLPAKIEANIVRGALRAGAKVIEAQARAIAPVAAPTAENARLYGGRPGLLRDSIRVSVNLVRGRVTAAIKAGGRGRKGQASAYYARWVELGTKPHRIVAGPGKLLPVGGGVKSVMHPGASKKGFLRPAMDSHGRAALETMREYIRTRLRNKHGLDVPGPGSNLDADE